MADSSKVKVSVTSKITGVTEPVSGVSFFIGETQRGPVGDPKDLIKSWPHYQAVYGGEVRGKDFPSMMKRYFESGGTARIARVVPADAAFPGELEIEDTEVSPNTLFKLASKETGTYSHNWDVSITAPSNGATNYFDLVIDTGDDRAEHYRNLVLMGPNFDSQDPYHFLDDVIERSQLVTPKYVTLDWDNLASNTPKTEDYQFENGDDGRAITAADYTDDDFKKFDDYSEAYHISVPGVYDANVHKLGVNYAQKRKDLFYFAELDPANLTTTDIKAAATAVGSKSQYTRYFGGALEYTANGQTVKVGNVADVCSKAAISEVEHNPWLSFAGRKRGVLANVDKVVPNFGSPSSILDLDELANAQVNMVIQRAGEVYLNGNFTALNYNDQQQWANVVKLIMYLRKTLVPTLENYLEEPNDIPTWSTIYYTIKPFFDRLSTGLNRALFDYSWEGDQFASSLDDLQINQKAEVLQGKYKVKLTIIPVASMQEFSLDIILDSTTGSAQIV